MLERGFDFEPWVSHKVRKIKFVVILLTNFLTHQRIFSIHPLVHHFLPLSWPFCFSFILIEQNLYNFYKGLNTRECIRYIQQFQQVYYKLKTYMRWKTHNSYVTTHTKFQVRYKSTYKCPKAHYFYACTHMWVHKFQCKCATHEGPT